VNYLQWLTFLLSLGAEVATSEGTNNRAIGYLGVLLAGVRAGTLSDTELTQLKAAYEEAVKLNTPVTPEELAALDAQIADRSRQIQSS
jgi:hypothetical protein